MNEKKKKCVDPENIHTTHRFETLHPTPLGILVKASHFSLKIWLLTPPSLLKIPMTVPGEGVEISWNHIIGNNSGIYSQEVVTQGKVLLS